MITAWWGILPPGKSCSPPLRSEDSETPFWVPSTLTPGFCGCRSWGGYFVNLPKSGNPDTHFYFSFLFVCPPRPPEGRAQTQGSGCRRLRTSSSPFTRSPSLVFWSVPSVTKPCLSPLSLSSKSHIAVCLWCARTTQEARYCFVRTYFKSPGMLLVYVYLILLLPLLIKNYIFKSHAFCQMDTQFFLLVLAKYPKHIHSSVFPGVGTILPPTPHVTDKSATNAVESLAIKPVKETWWGTCQKRNCWVPGQEWYS